MLVKIFLPTKKMASPPIVSPSTNTPVSFNRSTFLDDDFSPFPFLSSRSFIPLERLKVELNSVLKELKTELVELINQDYADFINLSSNLIGLDGLIGELSTPLDKIKVNVKSVRTTLDSTVTTLERKINQRALVRDKKVLFELYLPSYNILTISFIYSF